MGHQQSKVLEQRADGIWKGYVMHDGQGSRTGYFPSSAVLLVDKQTVSNRSMSRQGSITHPQQQHVRIPHAPDLITRSPQNTLSRTNQNVLNHNHHEVNSYGSIGADESFPPPPSPLLMAKTNKDMDSMHNLTYSQLQQTSNRLNNVNSDKTAEWLGGYTDGGVDGRLASPCRDSPVGSNRNSAASLGSGSSGHSSHMANHNYVNIQISNQQNRLSGQSYESGVSTSSRQSYDSTSSSSLGSLDRLEESGYSSTVNVHELFQAGLSDTDVIHAWLQDLHFEEYFNNFVQAGYDMPTITRMTPEDLTAIGIQKPAHRKRLKSEISKLHLHDGIPDFKPADLAEWLRLLNLDQYYDTLVSQGFGDLDGITDITWEDLEEIGIKKLGHQKKIMLAIDRLKRIQTGLKRLSSASDRRGSTEMLDPPASTRWSGDLHHTRQPSPHFAPHDVGAVPCRMPSGDSLHTTGSEIRSFQNPRDEENARSFAAEIVHMRQNKAPAPYKPDVVAIQVRSPLKGASMDALDSIDKQQVTYHSFHGPIETRTFAENVDANSNVDGDVTPTNERGGTPSDEVDSFSTLRRPAAMVSPRPKPKPVAKIVAKSKRMSREVPSDIIMIEKAESHELITGTLSKSGVPSSSSQGELIYAQPAVGSPSPQSPLAQPSRGSVNNSPSHSPTHYAMSPLKNKRMPPPPPKRTNSIKSVDNTSLQQALEAKRAELKHTDVFTQQQQQQPPPAPPPPPPPVPVLTSQTVPMSASLPAPGSTPFPTAAVNKAADNTKSKPQPSAAAGGQQQANFTDCVKSLATRFNKPDLKPVSSPAKPSPPPAKPSPPPAKPPASPGEDFPPPPPPIAMEIITPYKGQLHNQNKSSEHQKATSSVAAATGGDDWSCDDATGTVRRMKVKEDSSSPSLTSADRDSSSSTTSVDSNTSTSSIDSNTLPFANENVGTIKQRAPPNKPSILSSTGADVDSGDRNLDSTLFADNTGTIQRNASPLHREGRRMPPPAPRRPELPAADRPPSADVVSQDNLMEPPPTSKESGDVLNDIGNMLQDLTDELDAMLELELDV